MLIFFFLFFFSLSLSFGAFQKFSLKHTLCALVKTAFVVPTAGQPVWCFLFVFVVLFFHSILPFLHSIFVFYRMQVWIQTQAAFNVSPKALSKTTMAERRSILIYLWLIYLFIEYWDLFFLFASCIKYTNTWASGKPQPVKCSKHQTRPECKQ